MAVVFSPPCHGVSLAFASGMGGVTAPPRVSLGFANGVDPAQAAVVVLPPRCGFPLRSQTACVQRGQWWCSRCLCWPMAAVTGLVRGCAGSDDGGGVLAMSLLPLVMDLASGVGDGPVRTAVGFSSPRSGVSLAFANCVCPARTAVVLMPPRCGLPLVFANGAGPARTAVVLTPPLLAYGWCGWASSGMCRQRGQRWVSRCLVLCSRYAADVAGGRR